MIRKLLSIFTFLIILSSNSILCVAQKNKLTPIFNGKNLDGWNLVIDKIGVNTDPHNYVTVHDKTIHMYEHTNEADAVRFGYLRTVDSSYENYYLKLEYRWGDKKFAPRKKELKDAGVLYHVNGNYIVWPSCVEYQVQEGDTGDLIFLLSGGVTYQPPSGYKAPAGKGVPYLLPEMGGTPKKVGRGYYGRLPVLDSLTGWNTVEIIVHGNDYAEHLVNGQTIARTRDFVLEDGSALKKGSIAIQLEAAEIQYRNICVQRLEAPLKADVSWLKFAKGAETMRVKITNPGSKAQQLPVEFSGKNKDAFKIISDLPKKIQAHSSVEVTIAFRALSTEKTQSAGLKIGGQKMGAFIGLNAEL